MNAPGYSGTPLARKIGVKAGHRLALFAAPAGWAIPGLPDDVVSAPIAENETDIDVLIAFCRSLDQVGDAVDVAVRTIRPNGMVWLAWPRRAGGHESDITDDALRAAALPSGLVDVKVAAVDQDWSGLKFVWRKELRRQQ